MTRRPDSKTGRDRDASPAGDLDASLSSEALEAYADLGGRLAAQMAENTFRNITADPDWSAEDIDAETERALGRMDVLARDMHAARGLDPDGEQWSEVWTAMEWRYRERMDELLRGVGPRGRGTAQ